MIENVSNNRSLLFLFLFFLLFGRRRWKYDLSQRVDPRARIAPIINETNEGLGFL